MTCSTELVVEWINAFPIMTYIFDNMDGIYSEEASTNATTTKHKEEGVKRQKNDLEDLQCIKKELVKHSNPLLINSTELYNFVNGQFPLKKLM